MTTVAVAEPVVRVAGLMSRRVVGIRSDCDLTIAAQTFARTGLRHLVVTEPDRRVLGFVTADRVLVALSAGGATVRLRDLVEDAGVRILPQDDLRTAAGAMLEALVDAVLVTERSGRVVGVLTWSDVVAHVAGYSRPRPRSPSDDASRS
ncbi:CBS domain-containing protein [Nocardioides sp. URHA0020]|uniref:CBS domain-containing protein n=1 Tax=Nocardioides sp. URHA0020 TaxID=1380392 RepID=UPI00048C77D4|nr:CBS domain-containing protein [Nocardioides sp. URHA0020]